MVQPEKQMKNKNEDLNKCSAKLGTRPIGTNSLSPGQTKTCMPFILPWQQTYSFSIIEEIEEAGRSLGVQRK